MSGSGASSHGTGLLTTAILIGWSSIGGRNVARRGCANTSLSLSLSIDTSLFTFVVSLNPRLFVVVSKSSILMRQRKNATTARSTPKTDPTIIHVKGGGGVVRGTRLQKKQEQNYVRKLRNGTVHEIFLKVFTAKQCQNSVRNMKQYDVTNTRFEATTAISAITN